MRRPTWRPPGPCRGADLEGCQYRHPLFDRVSPVVVGGAYITTESGTGLVHTAPGHGQEDYQAGAGRGAGGCWGWGRLPLLGWCCRADGGACVGFVPGLVLGVVFGVELGNASAPPHPRCHPLPTPPRFLQVGQRYGLPLLSPVDDAGRFTDEAGPFAGLNVQSDGNEAVVRVRHRQHWALFLLLFLCCLLRTRQQ